VKIGEFDLNDKVMVIAEIGNNHEGSYGLAEEMIGLAKQAGASAVKFQVMVPEKLSTVLDSGRIEQLKRFQLSYEQFEKLHDAAKSEGIIFLATPFDIESAQFLESLVPAYKVSSGDNDFYPLLSTIAKTGLPILLSSGLADMEQIRRSKTFIETQWRENGVDGEMAILHCVTSYPTEANEANLLAIRTIADQFQLTVGYSDHTLGIEAAILSVALGSRVIEKHFTIDKYYSEFRDHQLSADPAEMGRLVEEVLKAEVLLGDGVKSLQAGEQKLVENVRRSIVAVRDLAEGTILNIEDLSWVRPGGGLKAGQEKELCRKTLTKDISKGHKIQLSDVK